MLPLAIPRVAKDEPEKAPQKAKASFSRKRKRGYRMQYSSHAESHVPCFQERVGTKHPGYMIPDRLPWRLRARPSATLHEIQVRSEERTCSHDATECRRRRQGEIAVGLSCMSRRETTASQRVQAFGALR